MIERFACRWSGASEAAAAALEVSRQTERGLTYAHARRAIAITAWKRGHLTEATKLADGYVSSLVDLGMTGTKWVSFASLLRGLILVHMGQFDEAQSVFSSEASRSETFMESRPSLLTTEFLGDVHLEQGHAEPALALYDAVFPKALALVPKGDIVAELRRRRAECYLLLDRPQEAYEEAKTGLEHCRDLGDRYEEAATYRVLALSTAALGNSAEAKRWFDQGFAYYDDIETPYEWGKLWMAYGDWLRGAHAAEFADMAAGLEAYQAAHDHFERMGALGKLAEAESRIAAASGRAVKPTTKMAREKATPRRRPRGSSELERKSQWAYDKFGMLTANKALLRMLDDVSKLSKTSSPLLVLGESGTGKELVATAVHQLSGRSGTYLPINCSSLPREVIESELFGHAQGAFTGAARDKAGLLEVCAGGTAFLDEIGEMSLELQSRLLRFLETGELRRVGATRNVRIDTRIVAATNRLPGELEAGNGFRQDLYYRLAHAVVVLPPLRQRGDDIELLAQHFLEAACVEQGKDVALSEEAVEALRAHRWPGNVRELKAVMKRVVILSPGDHVVTVTDLALKPATAPSTLLEELAHSEREKIAAMLKHVAGSRTEAAKALGIPRTTLLNKIRRYGLS